MKQLLITLLLSLFVGFFFSGCNRGESSTEGFDSEQVPLSLLANISGEKHMEDNIYSSEGQIIVYSVYIKSSGENVLAGFRYEKYLSDEDLFKEVPEIVINYMMDGGIWSSIFYELTEDNDGYDTFLLDYGRPGPENMPALFKNNNNVTSFKNNPILRGKYEYFVKLTEEMKKELLKL